MKTRPLPFLALASVLALGACGRPADPHAPPPGKTPPPALDQLDREELNFRAQERFLPLFWRADDNHDKKLDPSELAVLWGPQKARRADYVDEHGFTDAFYAAYRALLVPVDDGAREPKEKERRELVRKELRGGKPTLVETDLGAEPAEDRAVAQHVFAAAVTLEQIYAQQRGTDRYAAQVPTDDAASRAMFHRNQGPWCETPQLEKVPSCSALPARPPKRSGLYPLDIQADPKFCDMLAAQANGKLLMDHFSAVQHGAGGGFGAQPYTQAYPNEMAAIAKELDAAAAAISSPGEAPLKAYLGAAATAFRTNDWEPANVAWQKMGGSSSRWYLLVAPDEVYYEPCAWKAGFAVSFARINPESKSWRDKLEPVKAEMERALAQLAGPPYKARDVQFKLPDFIDIVLNAGDQRSAHGATIGESLPNWGPVAESGGRTVVMTNLYTDADSRRMLKQQMSSLFCAATDARASTDAKLSTMSTVLHEATHNFGPAHDYAAFGKKDSVAFGGTLASTLEELKAQTGALWFADWLVRKGLLPRKDAEEAHVRDVAWAFGHISRGMYEDDGKPKNYSQLASIQMGLLHQAGALVWKQEKSAGGDDGCFEIDLAKWGPAVDAMAARVLRIKARGDRKDAEALKAAFVDAKDEWTRLRGVITERWLRAPKATFVYSVR